MLARPGSAGTRRIRTAILALLLTSAILVVWAAAAMPPPYSWWTHSISESAAQGQAGGWIARAAFLAFGVAVAWLVLVSSGRWNLAARWSHGLFAACMISAAAFSHKPWQPPYPGDMTEDVLHSVAATAMGFAFAVGVVARLLARRDTRGYARLLDWLALIAAATLSPAAAMYPEFGGLLQRVMFGIAYLWYGMEAATGLSAVANSDTTGKTGTPGGDIRWRMHIPVPLERVYDALNTDAGRASFWAESAREIDGHVEFEFINGARHRARILERLPHRVFALEYFGGIARFELTPAGSSGTDLLLVHRGVDAAEWHDTHAGWLNVLMPLKAALAFGIDLRNHDPRRSWDQGYADQ